MKIWILKSLEGCSGTLPLSWINILLIWLTLTILSLVDMQNENEFRNLKKGVVCQTTQSLYFVIENVRVRLLLFKQAPRWMQIFLGTESEYCPLHNKMRRLHVEWENSLSHKHKDCVSLINTTHNKRYYKMKKNIRYIILIVIYIYINK